jgi:hypothetical protein
LNVAVLPAGFHRSIGYYSEIAGLMRESHELHATLDSQGPELEPSLKRQPKFQIGNQLPK